MNRLIGFGSIALFCKIILRGSNDSRRINIQLKELNPKLKIVVLPMDNGDAAEYL